jgi:hypothetical protein
VEDTDATVVYTHRCTTSKQSGHTVRADDRSESAHHPLGHSMDQALGSGGYCPTSSNANALCTFA